MNLFGIPVAILLLDLLGALMAALGFLETTRPGTFFPEAYTFPGYNWLLIIGGFLLMLPMILLNVRKAKEKSTRK